MLKANPIELPLPNAKMIRLQPNPEKCIGALKMDGMDSLKSVVYCAVHALVGMS